MLEPRSPPFSQPSSGLLPILQPCNRITRSSSRRLRSPILSRAETCTATTKRGRKKSANGKILADQVRVWVEKKVTSGVPARECSLPFLTNAPRMVECRICRRCIYSGEEVVCSVHDCQEAYHRTCARPKIGLPTFRSFKCPQHVCFICKLKPHWRCVRCIVAAHTKCAPWPVDVIYATNQPSCAVCWRHPSNWRLDREEAFHRLPLPYIAEEFKIGSIWKDIMESNTEPAPYVHLRRNVYLVKKKRDNTVAGVGCTYCSPGATCNGTCECRSLSISCSKACHCSDMCTNRPFRKGKKVKIVKTQFCGWGAVALEIIEEKDFVVEYIGEVIDDDLRERRLWDMKHRRDQNFYMCEFRKGFTIDATFKGNVCRFLNHSCDPNCNLEKWQVNGETRVGVFASRSIEVGEPLTYDYRFVHFGPMLKCSCGSTKCQGFLGNK